MWHMHALATAAVFFHVATAARVETDVEKEQQNRKLVCEDDSIWDQIMAKPDVDSIRGIPWKEIGDNIKNYLEQEAFLINQLKTEVEKLMAEIKEKSETQVSQTLSKEQIQSLISKSVSTTGGYGSVENAKNSACGKPKLGERPTIPFNAMQVSTESIVDFARPLLSTGEHKSLKSEFIDVCKGFLEAGEDELANYCGELCNELAEVVQGISDQSSNSVKDTTILKNKLIEKQRAQLDATKRQQQCQVTKGNIEEFQKYLFSLDKDIKAKHEAVRRAEYNLNNAQWALADLKQNLVVQQQKVANALELLTGSEQKVQEAKEALQGMNTDVDNLMQQIGAAQKLLDILREELSNLQKASAVTLEIQKYVSATALKMRHYVNMAVTEPVKQIGLLKETNVWEYFSKNVEEEECSATFKLQLTNFHQYCTGSAMAAFKKIKHIVDLTPLCKLGEESEIATEEVAVVQDRIRLLTDDLQNVQSWLDPLRGARMTKEQEQQKVDSGEPEGLRQVIGVYGSTKFYKKYLTNWKFNRGRFYKLLDQLKKQTNATEAKYLSKNELIENMTSDLEQLSAAQEKAQGKLNAALTEETESLDNKEQLEKARDSLQAQMTETQRLLTDLETALKQAQKLHRQALEKLVTEHTAQKDNVFASSLVHVQQGHLDMW